MEVLGLVDIPVWLFILVTLVGLYYFYSTANFGVFHKMGVKGPKPIPVFGNVHELMIKGMVPTESAWAKKYGRVYGIHEGRNPLLMVGDLDMLKEVTVKHFNSFTNRRDLGVRDYSQPPSTQFLLITADDTWKHIRLTLSPTFSTGKLKRLHENVRKAASSIVQNMRPIADKQECFDVKHYMSGFAMEAIASTLLGLEIDASSNHPFVTHARRFFEFTLFNPFLMVSFFIPALLPLMRVLKLQLFPTESCNFIAKVVDEALAERRKNPGKFADFLQLMLVAEKQSHATGAATPSEVHPDEVIDQGYWVDKRKGQGLTDMEILAQSISFFVAGFDTTATSLTYTLYHLALNPKCQDKLIAEIDKHFPNGAVPEYETLNDIAYLDMVVSESLRLNPPTARTDRICSQTVEISGIVIPAGMGVALPIYNIHHDPGYWPDPEKFDPERFTPENKATHHPLQWIPFGYGPRNCIGMRLALIEMKTAIIYLLQKYRFVPNSKTVPLRFGGTPLLTSTKDGVWLTAQNRE